MIVDSNGKFKEVWELSVYLMKRGVEIVKVAEDTHFSDGNFAKAGRDTDHILLRACGVGKPIINGALVEVNGKNYIAKR